MFNGQGYQKPKTLVAITLIFFMLLLTGCITNNNVSTSNTLPAGPIKIGVSISLTGDDSADGQATQKGYNVWASYVNSHGGLLGHQMQMVYYDDGPKRDRT